MISARALQKLLKSSAQVRVVDATWFLPGSPFAGPADTTAREAFNSERIQGAVFIDVDAISDAEYSAAPHNLPTLATFTAAMQELGIDRETSVVVYDQHGLFSAPRFWYTLRAFGHPTVAVLNGGLPAWKRDGFPVDGPETPLADFSASGSASAAVAWEKKADVQLNLDGMRALQAAPGDNIVVDARPAARFFGEAPEPRAGLRGGHMPCSTSLPFGDLLVKDDRTGGVLEMRSDDELRAIIVDGAGVDLSKPITTSCGSGMTACVVSLALERLGVEHSAVYDGSWSEWGAQPDTRVVKRGADGSDVAVP